MFNIYSICTLIFQRFRLLDKCKSTDNSDQMINHVIIMLLTSQKRTNSKIFIDKTFTMYTLLLSAKHNITNYRMMISYLYGDIISYRQLLQTGVKPRARNRVTGYYHFTPAVIPSPHITGRSFTVLQREMKKKNYIQKLIKTLLQIFYYPKHSDFYMKF